MMSFRRETPNTPQRPSLHAKSCMPNKTWRLYSRTQTHLLLGQRSIKLQLQFPVMSLTVAAHVERVLRGDYKTKLPICMTPAKNTCCPRDSCRYPRGGHHTCHLVCDDLSICATLLTTPGQVTQKPQWPCKTSIITAICRVARHILPFRQCPKSPPRLCPRSPRCPSCPLLEHHRCHQI